MCDSNSWPWSVVHMCTCLNLDYGGTKSVTGDETWPEILARFYFWVRELMQWIESCSSEGFCDERTSCWSRDVTVQVYICPWKSYFFSSKAVPDWSNFPISGALFWSWAKFVKSIPVESCSILESSFATILLHPDMCLISVAKVIGLWSVYTIKFLPSTMNRKCSIAL